jgi:hypothetical protein
MGGMKNKAEIAAFGRWLRERMEREISALAGRHGCGRELTKKLWLKAYAAEMEKLSA